MLSGMDLRVLGTAPDTEELAEALCVVAEKLDRNVCYAHHGRFHFTLGDGWTIAVSAESAGRLRVETCLRCSPRTRMWVLARKHDRLAGLVARMSQEVSELV